MTTIAQNWWTLFLVSFTLLLLVTIWMASIARRFYLNKDGLRSFSIFDLEFAATENMLDKIFALSTAPSRRQLQKHLWVDFLFMPLAYFTVALLCFKTATKMESFGYYLFLGLAVSQVLPWIFDVLENMYLFGKLNKSGPVSDVDSPGFKRFQFFVKAKFAIVLTGAICAVFGLLYFWLVGDYSFPSLLYLGVFVLELVLFFIVSKKFSGQRTTAA
jgi:hypothetical protein